MSDPGNHWRTSRFSGGTGCVAVNLRPDGGADVRDSKEPDGPVQRYTAREWSAFIEGVKAGEFNPRTTDAASS
jgi:hypothetical protein